MDQKSYQEQINQIREGLPNEEDQIYDDEYDEEEQYQDQIEYGDEEENEYEMDQL